MLTHLEGAGGGRICRPPPDLKHVGDAVPVLAVLASWRDSGAATDLKSHFRFGDCHSSEGPQGVVVLLVESETAPKLSIALRERGYRPSIQPLG